MADAAPIIAGWKRRLVALAETPEFVFRDTPQHLIEQHHRRLTTIVGYTEPEVAGAEARLGVRFPAVFREYLREMAKSPGDLFRGSHLAGIAEFEQFRADALELLAVTDPSLTLPPEAVVFLSHQGYTFVYLLAAGGFDGPPMQWTETEREPRPVAAGFADMVDAELRLMESNNAAFREKGGYYLTLHPEGGSSQSHPALASGERPLDQVPPGKPWWDTLSVSFAYHLVGSGWAECTIAVDEQHATMTASYLSDAFGDLLGAVVRMVEGQPEATASFAEEPGEYRWRFFRKEPDRLLIRVLDFPQLFGNRPDHEGKVLFEAECRLRTFAGAVLAESQRLLEKHGPEGYLGLWHNNEFPLEKQERLRQVLRDGTT